VFWGIGVVGFFGLALVVPVYTSCVPRGALRFFIKVLLTYQKKYIYIFQHRSTKDGNATDPLSSVIRTLSPGKFV
jgi:hypothetical protein